MSPRKDPYTEPDPSALQANRVLEPLAALHRIVLDLQDRVATLQTQTVELKNAVEGRQAHVENIRLAAKRREPTSEPKLEDL